MAYLDRYLEQHGKSEEFITESLALAAITEIRAYMRMHGVTQAELAKRLGVSQASVSKTLRQTGNMTLRTLGRIAAALNADWAPLRLSPEAQPRSITRLARAATADRVLRRASRTPKLTKEVPLR